MSLESIYQNWGKHLNLQHQKVIALVAILVFACCILGVMTRPFSHLAFFWPANAVLISIFLRFPKLNNPYGWFGAVLGYMTADLSTGNTLYLSTVLSIANLITVAVTLWLIRGFKVNYFDYDKGFTFLKLAAICGIAGFGSALFAVSTVPYVPNTFMSTDRLWIDFGMWWSGEMVNCVILLPFLLAFPKWKQVKHTLYNRRQLRFRPHKVFPVIAIALSIGFTYVFPGPGAMLYPLATLIWAALSYRLFSISIINIFIFVAAYHTLKTFFFDQSAEVYLASAVSVRIGLSMLVLAPLIVCIISRNRQKLFKEILYLANHDSLTHTMNRRYFFQAAETFLSRSPKSPFALMMLDIDYFKKINDQYGHNVGDHVLQHFSNLVNANMREQDLFARIGGEEFIVLLNNTRELEALEIAERIRKNIELEPLHLVGHAPIYLTVSIGITLQQFAKPQELKDYMITADFALYSAKSKGRNRVMIA